jgi:hypothetical protein
MKPAVVVIRRGPHTRPPLCPWFIDAPDSPPRGQR